MNVKTQTRPEKATALPATVIRDDGSNSGAIWLWRIVDDFTAELSAADCHTIYTAISSGLADGWLPTSTEIANLVDFARQQAVAAEHDPFARRTRRPSSGTQPSYTRGSRVPMYGRSR
jgi:hypothetical protein